MMKNEQPTILVVDDAASNIDILLELLSDDYDIMVALDGESALELASKESFDLILLDITMPKMDGYEVCTILKSDDATKDIPVIFITAKTDEKSIEKAYKVGGIDYVTKPFKFLELSARVKTQLNLKFLIQNLEHIASHDQMTNIYNRGKFFEVAKKKFQNSFEDLYAAMIDIDKFKNINDKYGHCVGDKVIKSVAQAISKHLDEGSVFGRLGGEEFDIVFNTDSLDKAAQKMDAIREEVSNIEIFSDDNESVKCTISLGYSKAKDDTKSIDALLRDADRGLYDAKDAGRNKSIFRDSR